MGKTKKIAKFKFLSIILIDKHLAFLALTQFLELRHPLVIREAFKNVLADFVR